MPPGVRPEDGGRPRDQPRRSPTASSVSPAVRSDPVGASVARTMDSDYAGRLPLS